MGRMIQSFCVEPQSAAYYAIEDWKRNGKNVSQIICDIIARHYELYDTVENQKSEIKRFNIALADALYKIQVQKYKWGSQMGEEE